MFRRVLLLCLLPAAAFGLGQGAAELTGEELRFPPGWKVLLDVPSDLVRIGDTEGDDVYFVTMAPGWHVTTRPGVVLWHPDLRTKGQYRADMEVHLFDPEGQNEAFGLFLGGSELAGEQPVYDSFLIRNSGEFAVVGRIGDYEEVIVDWTDSAAIRPYTDATEGSVANRLSVVVDPAEVHFEINGQKVETLSRDHVVTEGLTGLRVGRFLDLHVSKFDVEPAGD